MPQQPHVLGGWNEPQAWLDLQRQREKAKQEDAPPDGPPVEEHGRRTLGQ